MNRPLDNADNPIAGISGRAWPHEPNSQKTSTWRSILPEAYRRVRIPWIACEWFSLLPALAVTSAILLVFSPTKLIVGIIFASALLTLTWFDLKHERLPDQITLPLAWSGLAVVALTQTHSLPHHFAGLVLGYSSLWTIARVYRLWRNREGLGGGDTKLFAAAGAWVGWDGLPIVLFLSSASALCYAFSRRPITALDRIRFGPFLAFATFVVWAHLPHEGRSS
jgi:leader peptidase (prepilin peptidase)/N-methyltransferase